MSGNWVIAATFSAGELRAFMIGHGCVPSFNQNKLCYSPKVVKCGFYFFDSYQVIATNML